MGEQDAAAAALSTSHVGRVLGNYRLVQVLGEGGMGTVYLAEHAKLGRRVAVKLLKPEHAQNPPAVRRFFDEARVVNQINHEHIVEVIDFVEAAEEKYIVMELLQGQTLREAMEQGPVPLARVLDVAEQIALGLAAVHDAKVVHRDLKPDNVFLTERGGRRDFVKLLDFGVAKLSGDSGEAMSVNRTAAGALLGTPEYMAPEQLAGKAVDTRADSYAFGIILFELVTGKKPFVAESFGEIVIKHLTVPPPDPAALAKDLPPDLAALILQCLDKDPARRPANMRWVQSRVAVLRGGKAIEGAPLAAPAKKRAWLPLALGASACAAIAVAYIFWPRAAPAPVVAQDPPVVAAPAPVVAAPASVPIVAPEPTPEPAPVAAAADKNVEKGAAKGKKKGSKKKRRIDKGGLMDPYAE